MGETFKVEIINSIPEGEEISLYKHGEPGHEWVDGLRGPARPVDQLPQGHEAHQRGRPRTGAATSANPMLQRIYGTAFPSKEALEEHLKLTEEIAATTASSARSSTHVDEVRQILLSYSLLIEKGGLRHEFKRRASFRPTDERIRRSMEEGYEEC